MAYEDVHCDFSNSSIAFNDFAAYLSAQPSAVWSYSKSDFSLRTDAIAAIPLGNADDHGVNNSQLLRCFDIDPSTALIGKTVRRLKFARISEVPPALRAKDKNRLDNDESLDLIDGCSMQRSDYE